MRPGELNLAREHPIDLLEFLRVVEAVDDLERHMVPASFGL